jgi:O-antigen/teichoic acid export membrane protein
MDGKILAQDTSDIKRGAIVNFSGYLVKGIHPVLLIFVVRYYGAEAFGVFTVAQAILIFLMRFSLVGMDKSVLWRVSQQEKGSLLFSLKSIFFVTSVISIFTTLIVAFPGASFLSNIADAPQSEMPLKIMSIALLPMVWMELLLHMTAGLRKMEPSVIVRETLLPVSLVVFALILYPAGLGINGLATAYLFSYIFSFATAFYFFRKLFKGEKDEWKHLFPDKKIIKYGIPLWGGEMANSFLQRLDIYIVALLSYNILGIYAAVVQLANTIRSIRISFDPIVYSISSKIGKLRDTRRMTENLSFATFMVIATQFPVFVFFITFAQFIMPLYGEGFENGVKSVIILSFFWLLNSGISLSGIVIQGYGYSRIVLYNTLSNIIILTMLLKYFIPILGIEGAALSVGVAYSLLSIAQTIEMRFITGSWNYRKKAFRPFFEGTISYIVIFGAIFFIPDYNLLFIRITGFLIFAAIYLFRMIPLYKKYQASFNL